MSEPVDSTGSEVEPAPETEPQAAAPETEPQAAVPETEPQTPPPAARPTVPEVFQSLDLNAKIGLCGAAAAILAMFLPWIGVSILGVFSVSVSGWRITSGVLSLLVALAYAGLQLSPAFLPDIAKHERNVRIGALAAVSVVTLWVLIDVIRVGSLSRFGMWLALAANGTMVYAAVQQWLAFTKASKPTTGA